MLGPVSTGMGEHLWRTYHPGIFIKPPGWEGKGRSGITLAMQWFIHVRVHSLRKVHVDDHPAYTPDGV